MSKKQYWKGLEEINPSVQYTETASNEFREELPFEDTLSIAEAPTSRRDFLKYLGFSTAAATLAASCEMPVRKAIPYAIKPENITPGIPVTYASTFVDGGDAVPILVKVREGRPIKIEGNKDSSLTKGATTARIQGSVLNLYDATRLQRPSVNGKLIDTNEELDNAVKAAMATVAGQPIYLITSTVNSPSSLQVINEFKIKNSNVKHIMYDAVSYSGALDANLASFGKRAMPAYNFENAKTIVSIGADFLGTWLSPEIFAKQYSKGRKIDVKNPTMSKHYQFEGMYSITGANADERFTCKPSQYGAVALGLLNALSGTAASVSPTINEGIKKAAASLLATKGNSLVVCGSNDPSIQTIVNAINNAIGAIGSTMSMATTNNTKQGSDADVVAFEEALKNNQVGGVIIYDCNPVYELANGKAIGDKIKALKLSISLNDRLDETATVCKIAAPCHHFLESWGDAEAHSGYLSFMQPTINPLFKTRQWQDNLLAWSGNATSYADYFRTYWTAKLGGQAGYDSAIQKGILEPETMAMGGSFNAGSVGAASAAIAAVKTGAAGTVELITYEKVGIGRGAAWSNNPWLQELPDPITKCTWDNYILISPNRAKAMGAERTDLNEVENAKKVFSIKTNGITLELPVLVQPGMHDDVVAVAVGYGREKGAGKAAFNTGKNVYPIIINDKVTGTRNNISATVELANTGKTSDLAITQTHYSYESRPIIHEFSLEEFQKNPMELYNERKHEFEHFTHNYEAAHESEHGATQIETKHGETANGELDKDWQDDYRKNGTLYPHHDALGMKWGMAIDLNSCIGCGACSVACQAENNVSVVGKAQVMLVHDMHWIRIDRYFSGDPANADSIQTVFQPMMCQHCDNAPCENVCPVNASNHSSEGLNQMAYNRCIGTRYCANNCPYKVRRFNWRDWNGADCFEDNALEDETREDVNNAVTRMVLNPDVTVRGRGVMEKCSFCVQRLQSAKASAKKQSREMADGEANTACQTACPTEAIVFGNVNDKNSMIYKVRHELQKERVFHVLEEIHTLPNVSYLSKIRNTNSITGRSKEGHEGHEEKKVEHV
jgi:molybdopterin-containing oxidoreductase family iron-sulfur binding subunit